MPEALQWLLSKTTKSFPWGSVSWWAWGATLVACSHLTDNPALGSAGNVAAAGGVAASSGQAGNIARAGSGAAVQASRGGTGPGGASPLNSQGGRSASASGGRLNQAGGSAGQASAGNATRAGTAAFGGTVTAGTANGQGGMSAGASGRGPSQAGTGNVTTTGGSSASGGAASGGGPSAGAPTAGSRSGGATAAGGRGNQSGGKASATGGTTHTGVWNVMMLGDSITGYTCYPQLLSQQLIAGAHTNFALIGSVQNNQSCSGAPIVMTEGHGGYSVTYLPQNSTREACIRTTGCGSYAELQTWAASKPDIVLMHLGTNDVWDVQPTASIVTAYVSVIGEFRKQNPNVIFFVSKIIKLNPVGCSGCLTGVADLAATVTDSWASANSTATSPVFIIDHSGCGFDPATDASDGVHPTPAGAAKMATAAYDALVAKGYF